jgi:serine/threonine protein kinase
LQRRKPFRILQTPQWVYTYSLSETADEVDFIRSVVTIHYLIGLGHLHTLGIMHRDIKFENILFEEEGNLESLKIVDFGFSTFVSDYPFTLTK